MNKERIAPGYGKKSDNSLSSRRPGQRELPVCLTTTALSARGNITGHSAGIPAALYASSGSVNFGWLATSNQQLTEKRP